MINREIELIKFLNHHTALYEAGKPEISDLEWDTAYFELEELEKETGIVFPNSPTHTILFQTVSQLNKIKHTSPMLSLAKTKSYEEAEQFAGDKPTIVMAKMDGLTCRLTYENGKLYQAETRGDGEIGEDILHNARVVANIPQEIGYTEHLVIDGEIICTKKNFQKFADAYKNPRNFAAGSIRLLDSMECTRRGLSFVAWNVVEGFDENRYASYDLQSLLSYGFTCVPGCSFTDEMTMEETILAIKDQCEALSYPIDGCVIKYDNKDYYKSLGRTDHHYNGAIAFKFIDEKYETELLNIEYEVSRNGEMVPVAIFNPIQIEGTTIQKCSLFNLSVLENKLGKPYVGQKIWISKRNMVIPYIEDAEKANE